MLKTRIKAAQITNLTDARYFAAWGAEWLGFNLDEGADHFIHPSNIKAIKEWVEGPKIVGEFGLQNADEIRSAFEMLGLDMVQIGPFGDAAPLKAKNIPVIKELIVEKQTPYSSLSQSIHSQSCHVELFILNYSKNQIPWESLDTDKLLPLFEQFNILLSIDIDINNLHKILTALPVYGLDLRGGEEEKVGFKSFDDLDGIFEALETG